MAENITLSSYQKLQQVLHPNPEVDRAMYDKVQQDPELRDAASQYKTAIESGDPEKIKGVVYNLATQLAGREDLAGYEINPKDIREDVERQFATSFEQPTQPEQPAQQQSQPGVVGGFLKGLTDKKEQNIAGRHSDTASPALRSLQEEQLVSAFEDAIARGDDTAAGKLMGDALKIDGEQGLLQKQLELARQHAGALTPRQLEMYNIDREKLLQDIQSQAEKRAREFQRTQEKPEANKTDAEKAREKQIAERESELRTGLSQAMIGNDKEKKVQAYRNLVQHRIAQTRPYAIFTEFSSSAGGDMDRIFPALEAVIQGSLEARFAEQEGRKVQFARAQIAQQRQRQQSQRGGNGFLNSLRGLGKQQAKKFATKELKSYFEKIAIQALTKNPYFWLVVGIVIAVVLLVAIIIAIVIIIVSIFSNNGGGQPAQPGSTCTPSSACFAALKSENIYIGGGDYSLNGDPYGKLKLVYDTLSYISQPPSKYFQLLKTQQNPITIRFGGGGCAGHAGTDGTVSLYGFGACGTDVAKFMLIHELGHEIAFRNPSIYNKFYNQFPLPVLIFYKLPTYNCELDYGPHGPFPGECFADTLGEYVMYKTYRNTVSGLPRYFERAFTSFPTAFKPFYDFAKNNVYGGVEF